MLFQRTLMRSFFVLLSTAVQAQDFSTPEAAFREHQAAWAAKNIERFLATISFRQEALEHLRRTSPQDAEREQAVRELAMKGEADLRTQLQTKGFVATDLATCEVVTRWQDSADQVRLPLICAGPRRGTVSFPIRLMRLPEGWRIVRPVR